MNKTKELAKKGDYSFHSITDGPDSGVVMVKYKGKEIAQGDFDRHADTFFFSVPGQRGQKGFDQAMDALDYFDSKNITEAKATGEDSMSADAVTPAGGEPKMRKGDVKKKVDPKADEIEDDVKTPQGSNDEGLKESAFEQILEGEDLSEEFKTKVEAVFESTITEKADEIRNELTEQFEQELAEKVENINTDIVEKVDSYLDYVVENWLVENEVAVESSIKVEVAESLLDSLKGLVEQHNIEVDDEQVDAIAELENRLDEQEAKYNETFEQMLEIKEEKESLEREIAFATVSEELTDTQADKLGVLAESLSYDSIDEYTNKLVAIKESYFTESASSDKADEAEMLEEEVESNDDAKVLDESIARYAKVLDRHAK